ncbi:MAG TPA: GntR family transcriptional regulator, partial [Mycobacterium sp.]|nr:GntR family transcriptional regulator [Mycobacterium sp.]
MNAPAVPGGPRSLRREQLSDEVAEHLRAAIMVGTLRPGTFIRLDATAAQLGVSITPVREALRTLRGEGIVVLEPHRGHVVAPLSRRDVEDIFWLQATIARELAATAAEQIT